EIFVRAMRDVAGLEADDRLPAAAREFGARLVGPELPGAHIGGGAALQLDRAADEMVAAFHEEAHARMGRLGGAEHPARDRLLVAGEQALGRKPPDLLVAEDERDARPALQARGVFSADVEHDRQRKRRLRW